MKLLEFIKRYHYPIIFGLCFICFDVLAQGIFSVSPTDKSKEYLGIIFGGNVGAVSLGGGANPILPKMFQSFNFIIVTAGVVVLIYIGLVAAINTAREGQPMGSKFSLWVPLRSLLGMLLMIPTPGSGYSVIQMTIIWIVLNGIGAANSIWGIVLNQLSQGVQAVGSINVNNLISNASLSSLALNVINAQTCMMSINQMSNLTLTQTNGKVRIFVVQAPIQMDNPSNPTTLTQSATVSIGVADPASAGSPHPQYGNICGNFYITTTICNAQSTGGSGPPNPNCLDTFNSNAITQRLSIKTQALMAMFDAMSGASVILSSPGGYVEPPHGFFNAAYDAYRSGITQLAGGVQIGAGNRANQPPPANNQLLSALPGGTDLGFPGGAGGTFYGGEGGGPMTVGNIATLNAQSAAMNSLMQYQNQVTDQNLLGAMSGGNAGGGGGQPPGTLPPPGGSGPVPPSTSPWQHVQNLFASINAGANNGISWVSDPKANVYDPTIGAGIAGGRDLYYQAASGFQRDVIDPLTGAYRKTETGFNQYVADPLTGAYGSTASGLSDAYNFVSTGGIAQFWEQNPSEVVPITSTQTQAVAAMGWIHAGSYYFALSQTTNTNPLGTDAQSPPSASGVPVYAQTTPGADFNNPSFAPSQWSSSLFTSLQTPAYRTALNNALSHANTFSAGPPPPGDMLWTPPTSMSALGSGTGTTGNSYADAIFGQVSSYYTQPIMDFVQNELMGTGDIVRNARDPLVSISTFGSLLMAGGEFGAFAIMALSFTAILLLGNCSSMASLPFALLSAFGQLFGILFAFIIMLWTQGATLGIYVPLIPYIIFTGTAVGWLISVTEALVGGPIIALALTKPGGEELGQVGTAIGIIGAIFLRPTLMIFGFILAGGILRASLTMLNLGFMTAVNVLTPTIFSIIPTITLYVGMVVAIVNQAFDLIHTLPVKVLRFIGIQDDSGPPKMIDIAKGQFEAGAGVAQQGVKAIKDKSSEMMGSAKKGILGKGAWWGIKDKDKDKDK